MIDLDADVNTYLPFEVRIPHAPSVPISMLNLLTHTSAIRDRWQVWGTPWSQPTLYFHGDSPISLGDFCRSYFVHGGTRYRRRRNFYRSRAQGGRQSARQVRVEWTTLGQYLGWLERRGISPNVASFVGASTVRIHAMGYEARPATGRNSTGCASSPARRWPKAHSASPRP